MKKGPDFNGFDVDDIHTAMKDALKTVEKKFDIKISVGVVSYTETTFRTKLFATVKNTDTNAFDSPTVAKWKHNLWIHGLRWGITMETGTKFKDNAGFEFELVGMRTRAKNKLVVKPLGWKPGDSYTTHSHIGKFTIIEKE